MKSHSKVFQCTYCACLAIFLAGLTFGCKEEAFKNNPASNLVYRSVKAMGGVDHATEWTTRVEKGIFKTNWPGWGNLKANTTRHIVKPDKAKIDNDFSAYDHPFFLTYYINGEVAWQVVNLGVRQSPQLTERMKGYLEKADGLVYYLAHSDTFYIVDDVPVDSLLPVVSLERIGCVTGVDTVLFDIDSKSLLPLRQIETKDSKQTVFEDYRKTGSLKVPYHVTVYTDGRKTEEYIWESIEFDGKIDPAVFEEDRPAAADLPAEEDRPDSEDHSAAED